MSDQTARHPHANRIAFFQSIQGRLILFTNLLVLILTSALAALIYFQSHASITELKYADMSNFVHAENEVISTWLTTHLNEFEILAGTETARSMNAMRITPLLQSVSDADGVYEGVFALDDQGAILANTSGSIGLDLGDRDYFQQAMQGQPVISEPLISRLSGNVVVVIAVPIQSGEKVTGVLGGILNTGVLADEMQSARSGETGEAYLIDSNGLFITNSRFAEQLLDEERIQQRVELELENDSLGAQQALAGESGVQEYANYRGRQVIGAYAPVTVQGLNWGLLVEIETGEVFQGITNLRNTILLVLLVVMALATLVSIFYTRRITRPLQIMTGALHNLSVGDLNRAIASDVKLAI
ncbi:MAG: cache domain-containing protein, partial [Anaerolineaceae bacterium]|nr:cache domain-containing protein [Anaerolineaceae bacterium]